ncbi:hypothetical protein ACQVPL_04960 [Bacillus hominis]|uniref:hypothetical protein n=1 Tax=Bacillus hominis TaxID=2817478 RepID=UPI003D64BCBE
MDTKVSEILRMLNNYEGNEKEIFEQIQAEAMVKYKQCEEMIKNHQSSIIYTLIYILR